METETFYFRVVGPGVDHVQDCPAEDLDEALELVSMLVAKFKRDKPEDPPCTGESGHE